MESRRAHRVADLIRHEIAQILRKDVKDPRIGFVTLTDVEVSADLRVAKVYYTVLGDDSQRSETARGLQSAVTYIRREVGQRLRLKAVPEVRFLYDESLERGMRLQSVLEDLHHEPEEPDS